MDSQIAGNARPESGVRCLYYSTEMKGDIRRQMGTAHYSYRFTASRFTTAFRDHGYRPILVDMPEKYKRIADIEGTFGVCDGKPLHIVFRSTENIRLLANALNVCHFVWEFETLKDRELISKPITNNQKHMLNLVDEIWVASTYTREMLLRYGLHAHVVPLPVCGTALPTRQSKRDVIESIGSLATVPLLLSSGVSRELHAGMATALTDALANHPSVREWLVGRSRVFLTMCNPGDLRKNLVNAIDGFLLATDDRKADLLIVKLIVPSNEDYFGNMLFDHLLPRFSNHVAKYHPRVIFLADFLNDRQMAALYSLSDFYLSTSHCEGFNAPLLEAMTYGAVPVSTRNTAMRDFVDQDNAIVIDERAFPGLLPRMASDISGTSPTLSVASRFDIARAIHAALEVSRETYDCYVSRNYSLLQERYSGSAIMRLVENRVKALANKRGGNRDC